MSKHPQNNHPSGAVICRILGFTPAQSKGVNYHRVIRDPVIDERRVAAYKKRAGWPNDVNIFCSYKKVPARSDEAHLDFPSNFDIRDEASVLSIFNRMTERERQELRERVLDEELQTAIGEIIHQDLIAMQAGDMRRADSTGRIAALLSEWQARRQRLEK